MNRAAAIVLCLALMSLATARGAAPAVDYAKDIKPLLRDHCYVCHGALKQSGGLRLDTTDLMKRGGKHGPAIVPGKPDESPLIKKIRAGQMPPRDRLVEASVKPAEPADKPAEKK